MEIKVAFWRNMKVNAKEIKTEIARALYKSVVASLDLPLAVFDATKRQSAVSIPAQDREKHRKS